MKMKKALASLFVAVLLLTSVQSFAQLAVDKGSKFLNVGIGLGGYGGIGFGGGVIAIGASFEAGVAPNITVGAIGSFRPYSGYGSYYSIGARGSYHFNEILSISDEKLDFYAGLGLIYSGFSYKDSYYRGLYNYGGIGFGGHIGGRYFFSDKLGGFAEVGVGVAPLQLGLTAKF